MSGMFVKTTIYTLEKSLETTSENYVYYTYVCTSHCVYLTSELTKPLYSGHFNLAEWGVLIREVLIYYITEQSIPQHTIHITFAVSVDMGVPVMLLDFFFLVPIPGSGTPIPCSPILKSQSSKSSHIISPTPAYAWINLYSMYAEVIV